MDLLRAARVLKIVTVLCGCAITVGLADEAQEWRASVSFERFVMANGLTLITAEVADTSAAHVSIFYHVGEKDMRPGESGHAHLFEHLAFSRTADIDRSIWDFLEEIGASDYDANSRHDFTHYFATVPATALDRVLWMEAQRMGRVVGALTDVDLERSRKEVLDEEQKLLQVPWFRILMATWDHTYRGAHPYVGRRIYTEDVRRATLADARRFYERYYHPANAVLVVVGGIDAASVRRSVEAHFGSIRPGSPRKRSEPNIARSAETTRLRIEGLAPVSQLRFVWNIPGWGTMQADYLDLAIAILAERVARRMVDAEVTASTEMRELGGQAMLDVIPASREAFPEIEKVIRDEIGLLASEGPTRPELDLAFDQYRRHPSRQTRSLATLALLLGTSELLWGEPGRFEVMLSRAHEATSADVRTTVSAWLTVGAFVIELPRDRKTPSGAKKPEAEYHLRTSAK